MEIVSYVFNGIDVRARIEYDYGRGGCSFDRRGKDVSRDVHRYPS